MKELLAFCRSDSLSEEGLREILEGLYVLENIRTASISNYEFFHEACFNERVTEGILRLLLDYFPGAASSLCSEGNKRVIRKKRLTPLHTMCENENVTLGMVQLLIDAHPDSLSRSDEYGDMPLHYLCGNDDLDDDVGLEILKLLLVRCPESVRHPCEIGSLPIHSAAVKQSPEFCRILIEAYPESVRTGGCDGVLPFHWACKWNNLATVEYLYKLYPESISVAADDQSYPIHNTIWGLNNRNSENANEVVKFLLDCNRDVVFQKLRGKLPLYFVCEEATNLNTRTPWRFNASPYLKVLRLLYDAYPEAIEKRKVTSNVGSFCQEVQSFITTQLTYIRQARNHRVMTTPDESGQLPLHRALRDNVTLGSIKLLVKGNPSATRNFDNRGMIPLHVACQHHHSPSVVEYLIDLRSSALEMEDRWQNTLLHHACRGANHLMIAFLLEKYDAAFVSKRNSSRQLPIDLLFDSEAVSDREGIEYMESIYRLIRANPETVMGCDMNMNERRQAQSEIGKKRKVDDMK